MIRENREGCALLTVETDVNGDLGSTTERDAFLVGSLGSLCLFKKFLSCLGCCSRHRINLCFSSSYSFSVHLSTQQAGQQSCWLPVSVHDTVQMQTLGGGKKGGWGWGAPFCCIFHLASAPPPSIRNNTDGDKI
jgi:hypothetical protein